MGCHTWFRKMSNISIEEVKRQIIEEVSKEQNYVDPNQKLYEYLQCEEDEINDDNDITLLECDKKAILEIKEMSSQNHIDLFELFIEHQIEIISGHPIEEYNVHRNNKIPKGYVQKETFYIKPTTWIENDTEQTEKFDEGYYELTFIITEETNIHDVFRVAEYPLEYFNSFRKLILWLLKRKISGKYVKLNLKIILSLKKILKKKNITVYFC